MTAYFLSLGSNIEPQKHIPACLDLLKEKFTVRKISSIYETVPVGPGREMGTVPKSERGLSLFWNLAMKIETELPQAKVEVLLKKIEASLGRKRDPQNRFAPRTIDIDLLPFPDYEKQGFVMIPLAEIEPEGVDPKTGRTFSEIARSLNVKEGWAKKI